LPVNKPRIKRVALREIALFLGLLFFGLVILPIGIYLVGGEVFGSYAGAGFGDFFGALSGKIRSGEAVAWFLVLSPYIGVQIIRLTMLGWRLSGCATGDGGAKPA
jgi:hypothetical protein